MLKVSSVSPLVIRIEDNQLHVGERLKFDNGWRDSALAVLPPEREYVVLGQSTKLVRWMPAGPPDVIAAKPGEELPDIDQLNEAIPRASWSFDLNGKPRPPWAKWFTTVLLDPVDARLLSYGNSTIGTRIGFHELRERIQIMCALKGVEVLAVVQLADALMKTQFGDRRRPRFAITGWRQFRNGQMRLVDQSANALEVVEPPSLAEEVRDEITY